MDQFEQQQQKKFIENHCEFLKFFGKIALSFHFTFIFVFLNSKNYNKCEN